MPGAVSGSRAPAGAWFNPIAAHLGRAYWAPGTTRVQSFTTGTVQEIDFLEEALGLAPGARVLDVGCGPGRHALELARRGCDVTGVDLSTDFVRLAAEAAASAGLDARFEVLDVRDLAYDAEFDAAICLCQGGFGLLGGTDEEDVLRRIALALRPGGALALSAFSAPFALAHLESGEAFDLATGVLHETAVVRGEGGDDRSFDLWTTCFSPRELVLLAAACGLEPGGVHGVAPGRYGRDAPSLAHPELLLLARRFTRPAAAR